MHHVLIVNLHGSVITLPDRCYHLIWITGYLDPQAPVGCDQCSIKGSLNSSSADPSLETARSIGLKRFPLVSNGG